MSKLLKILYGFAALGLGVLLSVYLVSIAVSHDSKIEEVSTEVPLFPDYVTQMNTYYNDYENQRTHFHQTEERIFLPMEDQENCLTCHSLWPHKADVRTRAFNNQHSRYMSCMTCHLADQPGRPVTMEWYDFGVDNSITRQGPYGVGRDDDGALKGENNYISKIVPVVVDGDIRTRVYTSYNTPAYVKFREDVMAGDDSQKDKLRKETEILLSKEPVTCGYCHSETSSFPWVELKFRGDRLDEMRHSAVVGMVEKYESFYFPQVFE